MKSKAIITTILILCFTLPAQAQFLKKLKQKAEQAAERTILRKTDEVVSEKTEKTIDDATTKKNTPNEPRSNDSENPENNSAVTSGNMALENNTAAKKAFFKEDVVIKLHENGNLNQTQYFDANEVAVKLEQDNQPKSGYIDSEGFIYGYNEKEGAYNKSSLVASGGQGLMVPTMMLEAYKLPPEPFMANLQKQQDLGLTPNPFNGIVEFAFIYEPENFRYEDFKESKQTLRGKKYTKFEFLNEPGYEGSYVLFDDQDRLIEIYTNKTASSQPMDGFQMDMMPPGESLLVYDYKPVEVQLPPAREVKAQGQGMMDMLMGSFKKDKNTEDIDEDDYDTSDSKGQVKSVRNALKNNKVTANDLPDSYDFDYLYKTTFVQNSKKEGTNMDMNFLINTKNANYNGSEYIDSKLKDQGTMTMVFDLNLNVMAMFMKGQGNQNMLQIMPIPEVKNTDTKVDFTITELPPKTILGYHCSGLQLENEKYIIKAYHAKNAPISLNNFFGFGGSSGSKKLNLPDVDPKLLKQFENSLVMEMQYEDKKKDKNNFIISAKSIEKKPTSIEKKNYQSLDLFSGMNMLKN